MDTPDSPDRWREIRDIWKNTPWLYIFAGFLLGVLFFPALQLVSVDFNDLLQGLVPEAFGIVFTVLFIDRLYQRRDEQRRINDLQSQLVREVHQSNEMAKRAVGELRYHGWLEGEDGLLKGVNLREANLQNAKLSSANLKNANLFRANLEGAELWVANLESANMEEANLAGAILGGAKLQRVHLMRANLQRANLSRTNMQRSDLEAANMQGAILRRANLEGAFLEAAILKGTDLTNANMKGTKSRSAYLEGADLWDTNLQGAELEYASFDKNTRLPDGTYWTPETDLARFTNPNHPNFWRSDEEWSPAYRGKDEITSKD